MANVCITDAKYSEEIEKISNHNHDCCQIIFLKKGFLTATIAGKTYEAKAPSFIFISFMESHELIPGGNLFDRYCISIASSTEESADAFPLLTVLSRRPENFCHVLHLENEEDEKNAEMIVRSIAEEQESRLPYAEQKKELLLNELLIFLYRLDPLLFSEVSEKQDKVVWKVQRYLENNHKNSIDNQTLADLFHVSKSYLSHIFKEITGYSLHQYLMNCRLSSARTLLRETNLSVTEIAFEVGFDDSCNFSRIFHQKFGMTPREFRNICREEI